MLQTLKKGIVVLARTAVSVYGAIAWMIDCVYTFQSLVRGESYVLLKAFPMWQPMEEDEPRENVYKLLTCTKVRLEERPFVLIDPTLVRAVCHAYRACASLCRHHRGKILHYDSRCDEHWVLDPTYMPD